MSGERARAPCLPQTTVATVPTRSSCNIRFILSMSAQDYRTSGSAKNSAPSSGRGPRPASGSSWTHLAPSSSGMGKPSTSYQARRHIISRPPTRQPGFIYAPASHISRGRSYSAQTPSRATTAPGTSSSQSSLCTSPLPRDQGASSRYNVSRKSVMSRSGPQLNVSGGENPWVCALIESRGTGKEMGAALFDMTTGRCILTQVSAERL